MQIYIDFKFFNLNENIQAIDSAAQCFRSGFIQFRRIWNRVQVMIWIRFRNWVVKIHSNQMHFTQKKRLKYVLFRTFHLKSQYLFMAVPLFLLKKLFKWSQILFSNPNILATWWRNRIPVIFQFLTIWPNITHTVKY